MISTGSMAPCLLGYHRQIVCPSCSFAFSRGTHYDDDDTILAGSGSTSGVDIGSLAVAPATVCPNCGLSTIDTSAVPRNEGDQLLVQKHLFQLRPPRRWEIVVFRHPNDAAQAYVKRVVGLPNESIALIDGDVYADGTLQRKSLDTQRSMRIMVYDHDHQPTDADWQPRWRISDESSWSPHHAGFVFRHRSDDQPTLDEVDWLTYHHWIRDGGLHRTAVDLKSWPDGLGEPQSLDRRMSYSTGDRKLQFVGVMPRHTAARVRRASADASWRAAIDRLEEESHRSPVFDLYGYNHPDSGDGPLAVPDLMLEAIVRRVRGRGECRLKMTDGWHDFETVFDFARREVRLHIDGDVEPIDAGSFPAGAFAEAETMVEMSLFDRQVLIAIDGKRPFEPLAYTAEERPRELTSRPVQIGAEGIDLELSHVRLYRDVYYTPRQAPGSRDSADMGPDEFFVLGDNSPVSVDSRAWESPAIPRAMLIGKPFLVHLPSRQGRVEIAGQVQHIRIPDFSRVHYIR